MSKQADHSKKAETNRPKNSRKNLAMTSILLSTLHFLFCSTAVALSPVFPEAPPAS
jgi:hypothetical protein